MANTAAPVQTSTTTWNIDPAHSMAEFKVKHMMIANVKGQFGRRDTRLMTWGCAALAGRRKRNWIDKMDRL